MSRPTESVEVTVCPRGPMLLRGATSVRDSTGRAHEVTRPVVAVCLCGKTQREPWCDGTHKVIPVAVGRPSTPKSAGDASASSSRAGT